MTTNFYAPPSAIQNGRVILPEQEARHVQAVLRAEEGDLIVVVDGDGGWYRVRIDHMQPDQVVGTIRETRREVGEPDVDLVVGLGLLTKRSRFETFVEKAVELGVGTIVPLHTRHTETTTLREDRIRRVMIAALKQSRRSRLPTLRDPMPLESVLEVTKADVRFLCHGTSGGAMLPQVLTDVESEDRILGLVGPEGGFAPAEVDVASEHGCAVVSLGPRRLRAETAGLAVVHGVMLDRQRAAQR